MRTAPVVLPLSLVAACLALSAPARGNGELPASVVELSAPVPRVTPTFAAAEPPTDAARRALEVLARVESSVRETRYEHRTRVREREGLYLWDCSGMVDWVLSRSARTARSGVSGTRPVARDFFRAIDGAPRTRPRRGWQQLGGIADALPGDVLAWLRPADWGPGNTGHVAFLVAPAVRIAGYDGAWLARVADATSLPHEHDTRAGDADGGYGKGTLLFLTDARGVTTHYGWFGTETRYVVTTRVVFGRLHGR